MQKPALQQDIACCEFVCFMKYHQCILMHVTQLLTFICPACITGLKRLISARTCMKKAPHTSLQMFHSALQTANGMTKQKRALAPQCYTPQRRCHCRIPPQPAQKKKKTSPLTLQTVKKNTNQQLVTGLRRIFGNPRR